MRKNEIPLGAQIIQVADAYDAMTSERAYRSSLSSEAALIILEKEKGKQFNPKVVEAAIDIFKN